MSDSLQVTHEMLSSLERTVVEDIAVLLQKLANELESCLTNEKFTSVLREQLIAEQSELIAKQRELLKLHGYFGGDCE
jgi:two-component sensor histidine kinase